MTAATSIQNSPLPFTLKIIDGPHAGETFVFQKEILSLGRGAENDVVLPNDPKLSRNHIKIHCHPDVVTVENLSSRNPILFKDNYENKVELRPNDKILVGETEIQIIWEAPAGERTVQASAETLAEIHAEKTVVHPTKEKGESTTSPDEKASLTPAMPPPGASKAVDFKGAAIGAKVGVPEVRYTPTQGGISTSNHSDAGNLKKPASTGAKTSRSSQKRSTKSSSGMGPILLGLILIGAVIAVVMMPDEEKKTKKPVHLKDTDQIASELNRSAQAVEQHIRDKRLSEDGRMDRVYESAQSYYIKGFRDYRQGQYGRAIMSFQASLSFDPNHILSRKYLNQSIKKQAELIQFNLDQARRYRLKNNYRLCRSAAQQVMTMRKDQNDPQYKDAKGIFDECDTLSKGRF